MKFKLNFDDTAQNRLIIAGLLVSTVLIIAVSIFAIGKIQEKLYESYANFGQLLGKTIAIQSYELTKNKPQNEKIKILKSHSVSILESNSDISFITFKDDKGNIIFSTSENFKDKAENTKTNLSAPITNENGKIEGTVEIGLNASMASAIAKTTKNSMFIVCTLVWAVFTIVILINTFLITRELSILHQGVKAISGGKFGTLLEHKEVSGEIKELFSAFNDMSSRLHIYEEQLGRNHSLYAYGMNNLASYYMTTGEYEKAKLYYQGALELCKMLFGEESRNYEISLRNYQLASRKAAEQGGTV